VEEEIETDFINLKEIISYASSDYEKEFLALPKKATEIIEKEICK
jgi:hypothetical protein